MAAEQYYTTKTESPDIWYVKMEFDDSCAQKIYQFDQFMIEQGLMHALQWFGHSKSCIPTDT